MLKEVVDVLLIISTPTYVVCSESKERLRIQPAQVFHCTRSVVWCVQLSVDSYLAGKRFTDDEDLQHAVMDWLNSQAAIWYEEGISKLVSRSTSASMSKVTMWRSR